LSKGIADVWYHAEVPFGGSEIRPQTLDRES